MIYQVRIIFGDTDQLGVVYYANYLRFFEGARAASLRAMGRSHRAIDDWGIALPVVEAHCRYRRPAHYEDLLDIHVDITDIKGASLRFVYAVKRDDTLLADGYTRHAVVDFDGRPRAMPREFRQLLLDAQVEPKDRRID